MAVSLHHILLGVSISQFCCMSMARKKEENVHLMCVDKEQRSKDVETGHFISIELMDFDISSGQYNVGEWEIRFLEGALLQLFLKTLGCPALCI